MMKQIGGNMTEEEEMDDDESSEELEIDNRAEAISDSIAR